LSWNKAVVIWSWSVFNNFGNDSLVTPNAFDPVFCTFVLVNVRSVFHLGVCSSRLSFVSPGSQSGNPALAAAAAATAAAATSAQAFLAF